jgi:anti-sigma B factor antagonist
LGAAEVQQHRAKWQQAIEDDNVIFDLTETRMADSTGIGLLIRLRKRARELGRGFVLVAPGTQVRSALQLMQLQDFFAVENNLGEARLRVKQETGGTQLSVKNQAETMVIRWHGDITAVNAPALADRTEVQLSHQPPAKIVEIDLAGVSFVDSSGVGLMVRLRKQSLRHNIEFKFSNPTPNVLNVLRLLAIDAYLLDRKK